jgi:hypothetical protein
MSIRADARVDRSRAALRAALLALLDRKKFEDLTIRAITARHTPANSSRSP